jgi:hypothetical protein
MREEIQHIPVALAALVAICVAGLGGTAQGAGEGSYQSAKLVFDQTKPDKPSGTVVDIDYQNPADPQAQPPAVRRVVEEFAPGARLDTSVPGKCTASDGDLMLLGEQACPPGSKVGTGEVTVDTGVPGPARFVAAHVDFFNNVDQLIYLNTVQGTGARTVIRAQVAGRRVTTDVTTLPGVPPDGGAIDTVHASFPAFATAERGYLTTPPDCPSSGKWTNSIIFTYANGVTQTTDNSSPCEPTQTKHRKKCRHRKRHHQNLKRHHKRKCSHRGKHHHKGGGAK